MDVIKTIANKYNLFIIEDAAEAHGALYKHQPVGTFGLIGCFSFYGNKIITTGEGGMIITNDDTIADQCRKIKDLHHSKKRFIHDGIGYNYRLTNMQAAVGCGELKHLDEYVEKKNWMAELYNTLLKGIPGITLPNVSTSDIKRVYWMYTILVDETLYGCSKDELRTKLKAEGIDTRDFFYAPEEQPVLKDILGNQLFPNTTKIAEQGLYLPSGLAITKEQIEYVCVKIKEFSHR